MALKIKKSIKDENGNPIEIEGTEAEVEAFERKQKKKHESTQKKKEVLLGKAKKKLTERAALEELKDFVKEQLAKLQAVREHHYWYYNNGWWWRPWLFDGRVVYLYSQTQPTQYYNGSVDIFCTASNTSELSSAIGINESQVTNTSGNAILGTTLGTWHNGSYTANIATNAVPTYTTSNAIKCDNSNQVEIDVDTIRAICGIKDPVVN